MLSSHNARFSRSTRCYRPVLHFPTELIVYLLDVSLPSLLCAFVLYRSFHFPYLVTPGDEPTPAAAKLARSARSKRADDDESKYDSQYSNSDDDDRETQPSRRLSYGKDADGSSTPGGRGTEREAEYTPLSSLCSRWGGVVVEYLRCLCLGHAPIYSDLSMIYLIKVYTLGFATVALLLLSCVQARAYTFLLPQLHLVRFDVEADWTYRFQLITLQLMTLCLLAVATFSLLVWPSPDLSAAYFDKLYSLVLLKFERRRGSTAKSDDVLAMLDEETEALVRAKYQPPFHRHGHDHSDD